MNIYLNNPIYEIEMLTLLNAFYPFEENRIGEVEQSDYVISILENECQLAHFHNNEILIKNVVDMPTELITGLKVSDKEAVKGLKRFLKRIFYDLLSEVTGIVLPWGTLTGIRPTKLAFKLYKKFDGDISQVTKALTTSYRVSEVKAQLLVQVMKTEQPYLGTEPNEHSIYIGVPFCPTKCSYCTFTSYQSDKWKDAYEVYADALCEELTAGGEYFHNCSSVYVGGGTPTSLTEEDFDKVLATVRELSGDRIVEFTVEAGRPDSISTKKLESMKRYGVTRISINPQTMQDETLSRIGRMHKAKDITDIFFESRSMGFDHINMDLIIGLPGESTEDIANTLKQVIKLSPESITVHTLAYKRGSRLSESSKVHLEAGDGLIKESLLMVQQEMLMAGYHPYYLYRQKQMVGQYENVGYCKPGHESVYNIRIMEEVENNIGFGAGAISKKVTGDKIKRLDQPKDVRTYLSKVDQIIEKKRLFFK